MRTWIVLVALCALLLAGCKKDDQASASTSTSTTTEQSSRTDIMADPASTDEPKAEPAGEPGKAAPDVAVGSQDPDTPVSSESEPSKPPAKGATQAGYVGHYKLSVGLGANWKLYLMELRADGLCEVKLMEAEAKKEAEVRQGKWREEGGKAIIEWPGESPMVLTLDGTEMISEQFDTRKWPGKRLIFYKRG